MRKLLLTLICSVAVGSGTSALAAPLNLTLNDHPDVTAGFIDLSYIANNSPNNFQAIGYDMAMDDDGIGPLLDPFSYDYGSFQILANITTAGVMTGGTITISGNYSNTIGISGVLLTGNLTAFGWTNGAFNELFEFTYTVTGGLMATSQYFGVPGSPGGVIYDTQENVFNGSFASSFFSSGFASPNADVAPIPEPATVSLVLLAGLTLVRPLRRRAAPGRP